MARKKSTAGEPIELSVSFGNVSVGDKTVSVGISIDRESFSIGQADEMLCGHRILGTIVGRPLGNNADQGNLPGAGLADDITLGTTFDVGKFSVSRKKIGCTLAANLSDVPVDVFCQFARRNGKFIISKVYEPEEQKTPAAQAPKPIEEDEFDAEEEAA